MSAFDIDRQLKQAHNRFEELLLQFCGPIYIAPNVTAPPSQIIANGTFGLVDTGIGQFLITCFHVWEAYLENKDAHPDAVLVIVLGTGIKARVFDPKLIDGARDVDLAVLAWDNGYIGEKRFFSVKQFPIRRAEPGNLIAFQGFPGASREGTDSQARFGACFFGGIVTDVNERRILVENDHPRGLHSVTTEEPLPPLNVGGMSGSPAYTIRDGLELVGFLTEGSSTDRRLLLAHASFIKPDGTLDRSQLK